MSVNLEREMSEIQENLENLLLKVKSDKNNTLSNVSIRDSVQRESDKLSILRGIRDAYFFKKVLDDDKESDI